VQSDFVYCTTYNNMHHCLCLHVFIFVFLFALPVYLLLFICFICFNPALVLQNGNKTFKVGGRHTQTDSWLVLAVGEEKQHE